MMTNQGSLLELAPAFESRGYQSTAVEDVFAAWADGHSAIGLSMPTGTGKTATAGMIARRLADAGERAAFITDRLVLIPQALREFQQFNLTCGVIQGSNTSSQSLLNTANVLCCSAQTLDARHVEPDDLRVNVAIVDEFHIERQIIRRWLDQGVPMLGLSATPLARWLTEGEYPPWQILIQPLTTRAAMNEEWILDPIFRAELPDPTVDVPDSVGSPAGGEGDWSDDQAEAIMMPHVDAVRDAWLRVVKASCRDAGFNGHRPGTLIQAATVRHACALRECFNATLQDDEKRWAVVSYQQTTNECIDLVNAFRRGDLQGLISVWKLAVGVDAPDAMMFVSARPTRRLLSWIQSIGRILRQPSSDILHEFPHAIVLDCAGNGHAHAGALHRFWTHGAKWPLQQHSFSAGQLPTDQIVQMSPCPAHPTIVQTPGSTVCCVCFRALNPAPTPVDAITWKDAVTPGEFGKSIVLLGRRRMRYGPAARHVQDWCRIQVKVLTGHWPADGWPAEDRLVDADPFDVEAPHPVVSRMVRRNTRLWKEWSRTPVDERPATCPTERIGLKR